MEERKRGKKRGPQEQRPHGFDYDLSGKSYGSLTVRGPGGSGRWLCECSCGGLAEASTADLLTGEARSCGCEEPADLAGTRVGCLEVIGRAPGGGGWLCRCDCGSYATSTSGPLAAGLRRCCGPRCPHGTACGSGARGLQLGGLRYGRLQALRPTGERGKDKSAVWELVCDCGRGTTLRATAVMQGHARSCGCAKHSPRPGRIVPRSRSDAEIAEIVAQAGRRPVVEIIAEHGISRTTFYRWRAIAAAGGLSGGGGTMREGRDSTPAEKATAEGKEEA